MKGLFLLFTVFACKVTFCQFKNLSTKNVQRLWLKELFCMDSLGNKTSLCEYSPNTFIVTFKAASFNKKTGQLRLTGRLSPPIPEVGLYLSDSNKIQPREALAYTTYDSVNIEKGGYFDILLNVKANQSLFFHHQQFYCRQFELHKLFH